MLSARRLIPVSSRLLHGFRPSPMCWSHQHSAALSGPVGFAPARHLLQRRFIRVGPKEKPQTMVQDRPVEEQYQQQDAALQQAQQAHVAWKATEGTAAKVMEGDVGLQRHLQRTALQTAAGLAVTAVSATACIVGALPLFVGKTMLIPGLVALGCLFGASMMRPTIQRDELGHLTSANSPVRQLLANSFFFLQGMVLAPLVAMFSPSVIAAAGLATVGVAAGMAAFALSKPQGALLSWGGPLMVGVFGLLFCSIGGMFLGGAAASSMFWVTTIGGLGIFSAFVAYDIQSSIQQYKEGYPDHLGHAINMYINLINIFRSLLVLLGVMED